MARSNLVTLANAVASLAVVACLGCDPCACVNGCVRGYALHSTDSMAGSSPAVGVGITNRSESGMDCDIDEVPRSLPDGPTVIRGEVRRVGIATPSADGSPRFRYDIELAASGKPSDATKICSGVSRTYDDVAAFAADEVAVGESVCVSGNVRAETMCTQKGCGY